MLKTQEKTRTQKEINTFFLFTITSFYIIAFFYASPSEILKGLIDILSGRDILITDYFVLAGVGASLFNAAIVMTITYLLFIFLKVNFSGLSIAAMLLMGGFALFGKNPANILPIILGTFIYSLIYKTNPSKYIYTALLATGVAPIISELATILPFTPFINWLIGILCGIFIGMAIPALAAHTASMHMGYNLFNVGFAVGILAMMIVSLVRSFGYDIQTVLIWQTGASTSIIILLFSYFALMILYGLYLCNWKIKPFIRIMRHPGRAIADFILMDGVGPTMINMGVMGILSTSYILFIGGDLNGPVIGAIFTVCGFSAFGVHLKNYTPLLIGVFLSTFIKVFSATSPALQLAALFASGLSPIAGQFGWGVGILAGFMHASVVTNIGTVYAGLNLYNNGFAAGFVAIILVPIIEGFIKQFKKD